MCCGSFTVTSKTGYVKMCMHIGGDLLCYKYKTVSALPQPFTFGTNLY